jgi:MinD-like ATPase involved in chromosome partitioning or flagellar assembly
MIKIRLIIADTDERYLNRLSDYIVFHYADQFEISIFTDPEILPDLATLNSFHCVLATSEFMESLNDVNVKAAFLLLYDGGSLPENYEGKFVSKYQNVEHIIKEIKTVSADKIGFIPYGQEESRLKIYLAEGVAGGTGTTTIAIAFARYLVRSGKRVLYLNLEANGCIDSIFNKEGNHDFSDVLYLLKAQKGNLELKIDGIVQKDFSGVDYIEPCRIAMDLQSLKEDDIKLLLEVLEKGGKYDYVIMDRDFGLSEVDFALREKAHHLIYVSSGLPMQNSKFKKAHTALSMYEEKTGASICKKVLLVYNQYSNRRSKKLDGIFEEITGFPKIEAADENGVVEELVKKDGFAALM